MSKLIDPTTGQKVGAKERADELTQMFMAVRQLHAKVDALTNQQVQFGLFLEFFTEQALSLVDENDDALLQIDMKQFPEWANARVAEIKEEAATFMQQQQAQAETRPQIDLSDE